MQRYLNSVILCGILMDKPVPFREGLCLSHIKCSTHIINVLLPRMAERTLAVGKTVYITGFLTAKYHQKNGYSTPEIYVQGLVMPYTHPHHINTFELTAPLIHMTECPYRPGSDVWVLRYMKGRGKRILLPVTTKDPEFRQKIRRKDGEKLIICKGTIQTVSFRGKAITELVPQSIQVEGCAG